uniref:Uncharacterized protein n=1 Tax=Anguilla anguilla TaxID=7936 RepID=A0A0E9RP73_ANGAN
MLKLCGHNFCGQNVTHSCRSQGKTRFTQFSLSLYII